MHRASEQVLLVVRKQAPVAHLHEHVHVAAWSRFTASDRPIHAHGPRTMPRRDPRDFIAAKA